MPKPWANLVVRVAQCTSVASKAATEFVNALQNGPVRLLACHGQIQLGRGRRWFTALNHSTVLLTVAAWEQYVESILLEAFAKFDPGEAAPVYDQKRHGQRRGEIKTEIHKVRTPNAENTQRLFQTTLGVDPTTGWAMQVYGRKPWGHFTVAQARTRLNEIRFGIARHMGTRFLNMHGIRPLRLERPRHCGSCSSSKNWSTKQTRASGDSWLASSMSPMPGRMHQRPSILPLFRNRQTPIGRLTNHSTRPLATLVGSLLSRRVSSTARRLKGFLIPAR